MERVARVEDAAPGAPGAAQKEYRGYRNNRAQKLHTDSPAPDCAVDEVVMGCARPAARSSAAS